MRTALLAAIAQGAAAGAAETSAATRRTAWRLLHYNPLTARTAERLDDIESACESYDFVGLIGTQRRWDLPIQQQRAGERWRIEMAGKEQASAISLRACSSVSATSSNPDTCGG
eukprot:1980707-Pyramimonas_sp.AAC.1